MLAAIAFGFWVGSAGKQSALFFQKFVFSVDDQAMCPSLGQTHFVTRFSSSDTTNHKQLKAHNNNKLCVIAVIHRPSLL